MMVQAIPSSDPADRVLSEDNPLTLGMECALWTDYGLTEDMLGNRLFPRIYAVAELMCFFLIFAVGEKQPFYSYASFSCLCTFNPVTYQPVRLLISSTTTSK